MGNRKWEIENGKFISLDLLVGNAENIIIFQQRLSIKIHNKRKAIDTAVDDNGKSYPEMEI